MHVKRRKFGKLCLGSLKKVKEYAAHAEINREVS